MAKLESLKPAAASPVPAKKIKINPCLVLSSSYDSHHFIGMGNLWTDRDDRSLYVQLAQ